MSNGAGWVGFWELLAIMCGLCIFGVVFPSDVGDGLLIIGLLIMASIFTRIAVVLRERERVRRGR